MIIELVSFLFHGRRATGAHFYFCALLFLIVSSRALFPFLALCLFITFEIDGGKKGVCPVVSTFFPRVTAPFYARIPFHFFSKIVFGGAPIMGL